MTRLILAVLLFITALLIQAQQPSGIKAQSSKSTVISSTVAPAPATAAIPLTDHETAMYRSAQIRVVKAQIAIASDQLWKELQAAQAELNSLPGAFITSRKLDIGTHALCDGPVKGEHACDGLVEGQLGIGALTPASATPAAAPTVKK